MKQELPLLALLAKFTNHSLVVQFRAFFTALLIIISLNVTAQTADCSCVNSSSNLITNGSFENGTTGWNTSGGSLTTGTGYVMCGSQNGFLNWSSGSAKLWQLVAGQEGNTYTFKAYAGTHTPGISCSPKVSLIFLNSSGSVIGTPITATVTKDVDVTGSNLTLYTLTATAPAGTSTVRPEVSINCNVLKLDALCLTVTTPPVDCSCVNSSSNILTNPSFENGTTGWTAVNGSFSTGTGYEMCGSANGFLYASTGTALVYQDKAVLAGSLVTFKGYSGTHTPGISCSPKLSLIYLNSAGSIISRLDASVTKDVDATGPSLAQYTLSGIAPSGTVTVRVQGSIGCDYLKVDAFCLTISPAPYSTNPDLNTTFVNVTVPGNVSTNDNVPAGTTYGITPTLLLSPAGSAQTLTMNSKGMYSFTADKPGVYTYDVPVCVPGQTAPCPNTKLVITVLNANSNANSPVANADVATTNLNTAVTLKTLANDAAGNATTSLVPSSVIVTVAPKNGTTMVSSTGDITYTPTTGFSGRDTLTYQVCDNQSPAKCATAIQIITVNPAGTPNSTAAADDYKITSINTPATGNVKTNDSDAEGNTQTVTAQTTTVAGKGTLVLATDGSYTFTPVTGFTGPVDFPYTTCDNGTLSACASATLHILVRPVAPSTNPDFNSTFVNVAVPGNVSTNDNVPAGTTYGTTPALLSSPAGSTQTLTMNSNGTYSFTANTPGVYTYDVPVCVPGQVAPCPPTKLVINVLNANIATNAPVANADIATTNLNTAVTLRTLANDAAGNANTALVPSSVIVTSAPTRGTATVNATTGDITYTPTTGFSGRDTLTYQVCDNQSPAKCATAIQIITVNPAGTPNTTTATDDYKVTPLNTVATGNVKTNDSDAEGNAQTVTVQTTTVTGKGTLVLAADGSYTFIPVNGFTGPVDFPYTICDNGTPQACAIATLHILVQPLVPLPDLTPRIILNPNNIIGKSSLEITVQVNELNNIVTNGSVITMYVDKQSFFNNFSFNGAQTVNKAGQSVQNSLFTVDAVSNPDFYVITTNAVFANSLLRLTFSVTVDPGQTKGVTPLKVSLLNGSGGETNFANNSNSTVLTFSF